MAQRSRFDLGLALLAMFTAACSTDNPASSTAPAAFASERALCLSTINNLRATRNLPGYGVDDGEDLCADGQASTDASTMQPHSAFTGGTTCEANAQAECPNYGTDIATMLPQCLQQMWAEKDRPQCAGCDTCDYPFNNCTNCTFSGTNGSDGCGHYLSMKSSVFTQVSCGFSNAGWYVQDYH